MNRVRQAIFAVAVVFAGVGFSSNLSAQQEAACYSTGAVFCGVAVQISNPDFPCQTQNGMLFCPVFNTYRSNQVLV